ncbi:TBPIP-domain-containing protein [Phlegmacium glaucopus]|nr:TBPIP-domain-containing protein [Phlegmacium glaucopus]
MNRPYGAVDVAANLKGAIPKTATQKILLVLADKGELVQKTYGKTTFFVYNQEKIESMPSEKLAELKKDLASLEDENKLLANEVKIYTTELSKLKAMPTDEDIASQITSVEESIRQTIKRLEPLRSGARPISAEEVELVYSDWTKWRAEWVLRKKVFIRFWELATDALAPQDTKSLEEDLGIEVDTPEHVCLEQGPLCSLKRKRV